MSSQIELVENVLRENGINRLEVKIEKNILTSENLDQFKILSNRRDIRRGVVSKLKRLLNQGKHFDTPIVTNRRGEQDRLLDGNHRILAITEFLEKYPDRKVEILICYYDNLSDVEEKVKYTQWNSGTKQNANDFIKQYWDELWIALEINKLFKQKKFPCGVSHNGKLKDSIELKTLIAPYLTKDDEIYSGAYKGSARLLVDKIKSLGQADLNDLRAFMMDFIEIFGMPEKSENLHYKQCNFWVLFRIWNDNRTRVPRQRLLDDFAKVRMCAKVQYWSTMGGSQVNVIHCRNELLEVMNGIRKKDLLV